MQSAQELAAAAGFEAVSYSPPELAVAAGFDVCRAKTGGARVVVHGAGELETRLMILGPEATVGDIVALVAPYLDLDGVRIEGLD